MVVVSVSRLAESSVSDLSPGSPCSANRASAGTVLVCVCENNHLMERVQETVQSP